ncbi:MAG: hypothetical protein KGJ02_00540 [Verrucomicrobiota bacterium]|nr:hypothetical protein [Verrucomicrobiota bacterium]
MNSINVVSFTEQVEGASTTNGNVWTEIPDKSPFWRSLIEHVNTEIRQVLETKELHEGEAHSQKIHRQIEKITTIKEQLGPEVVAKMKGIIPSVNKQVGQKKDLQMLAGFTEAILLSASILLTAYILALLECNLLFFLLILPCIFTVLHGTAVTNRAIRIEPMWDIDDALHLLERYESRSALLRK